MESSGDNDKYEIKFERQKVCLRMSGLEESGEDIVKEGLLQVRKGMYGHEVIWTPNNEGDKDLAISFNLKELKSFARVVPYGGLSSFIVFHLKSGESCLPLEFHQGGTRELIRSFQGLLQYKRSEHNQNEYIVVETSPDLITQAMESLNLFEGASLEFSLPHTPPLSSGPWRAPPVSAHGVVRNRGAGAWRQAPMKAREGVMMVGRMMRELVTDRPRPNELEVDQAVARLHYEDTLPVVSRQDCGFEVLSKKSTLQEIPRPMIKRDHPLTRTEWESHLDREGRVTCHEQVLEKIFHGGVEQELRQIAWKYLLDYFKWGNTAQENEQLAQKRKDEYYAMKYQWKSMIEEQLKRNAVVRDRKLQIEKDVKRTDRALDFFRDEDSENMAMLFDILMTYTMYNFDLGYVQGMNDLLSPILMLMEQEHHAFWCFAGLMDRMERNFEVDQSGMKQQLQQLSSLTQTLDEELFDHLEKAESQNMYFCFRWLLLHFKREFSVTDAMRMYEVLWSDLPCPNFHLLVAMAILEAERDFLLKCKPDLTEILKHVNEMALKIDLDRCLAVAEGIHAQMRHCDDLPDDIIDIFGVNGDTRSLPSSHQSPQ